MIKIKVLYVIGRMIIVVHELDIAIVRKNNNNNNNNEKIVRGNSNSKIYIVSILMLNYDRDMKNVTFILLIIIKLLYAEIYFDKVLIKN